MSKMPLKSSTFQQNPGGHVTQQVPSFKRIIKKTAQSLLKGEVRYAFRSFGVGILNLWEQGALKKRFPRFICSCCNQVCYSFIHSCNELRVAWNSICPHCDSRSRHRGLALIYPELLKDSEDFKVLHIAPEPVLMKVVQTFSKLSYKTSDLYLKEVDYPSEDLQKLSLSDHSFDLVLCNHVLEHIQEDQLAVKEIARILKPYGKAVITVPGEFTRTETVFFKDNSLNGHYRDYGLDIQELFSQFFSKVEMRDMSELNLNKGSLSYGIREKDMVFICEKGRGA